MTAGIPLANRAGIADAPILRIERVIVDQGAPGEPPIRREMEVEKWAAAHGAEIG